MQTPDVRRLRQRLPVALCTLLDAAQAEDTDFAHAHNLLSRSAPDGEGRRFLVLDPNQAKAQSCGGATTVEAAARLVDLGVLQPASALEGGVLRWLWLTEDSGSLLPHDRRADPVELIRNPSRETVAQGLSMPFRSL